MTRTQGQRSLRLLPPVVLCLAAPWTLVAHRAPAQDFGPDEDSSGLNYILGAAVMRSPVFEGAKDYKTSALPFFLITYGNRATVDITGIQYDIYETGPLTLTAGLGYDWGRKESESDHLDGLGDIDGGLGVGFGVDYTAGPVNLFADLSRTFDGSEGLTGKFGAEVSRPLGEVMLAASVTAMWADDRYMEAYFGVTTAQSAASGLPEYDAGAGLSSVGVELSATYFLNDHWIMRGQVGVSELLGDAADSPVVQETSQSSASIMVGYRF